MSWRSGYSRPAAGTARRGPPLSPPGPRLVAGPPRARPSVPGLLAQSPPWCVSPQLRRLGHCSWLLAELWKPPRLNAAPADVTAACDQSAPRGPSVNHSASPGPGECGETAFRGSVAAAPAAPRCADGGHHLARAPSCSGSRMTLGPWTEPAQSPPAAIDPEDGGRPWPFPSSPFCSRTAQGAEKSDKAMKGGIWGGAGSRRLPHGEYTPSYTRSGGGRKEHPWTLPVPEATQTPPRLALHPPERLNLFTVPLVLDENVGSSDSSQPWATASLFEPPALSLGLGFEGKVAKPPKS
ncbi:translation initiation factor IF-2-like isoform X2 [Trachypithecus francoisi]|uniref:translation initiation factor IF-2-like isoform X2 n=1 Tax=Trachypithecus francoisi TaxID=54180 RepID=UPI00141B9D8F|nr:translation initiation factor IF-2-like isoform X2 [Trachypithecus francoisi]